MLKIKGSRFLDVNGETNIMKVEGLIRLRDINADNTVYSYNIADAKISYKKSGLVNKIAKPGSFQRWTTWLIGIGLMVLSVYGAVS
jgi:flagellar L-ring protein precursor FlgH